MSKDVDEEAEAVIAGLCGCSTGFVCSHCYNDNEHGIIGVLRTEDGQFATCTKCGLQYQASAHGGWNRQ